MLLFLSHLSLQPLTLPGEHLEGWKPDFSGPQDMDRCQAPQGPVLPLAGEVGSGHFSACLVFKK